MEEKKFNIVMFPWFAMGHFTPYLHLANQLAQRGYKTTLLLPEKPKLQLLHLNLYPSLITLHPITVPHVDPLPLGASTVSDVPGHLQPYLATAFDLTRPEVESIILGLNPDIIFYDIAYWIPEIAAKLGIKTLCYNVVSAASLAIAFVPARKFTLDRPITEEDMACPPPGYPSNDVVLLGAEARNLLFVSAKFGSDGITFYERVSTAMMSCDAIAIRTCKEIEGNFCDYISSQYNKPVFLTGSTLPESGLEKETLDPSLAKWLGQFKVGSVIYCAFGSQITLEKNQFQELLLGFELTEMPFLVALRPPLGCMTVEEAMPKGWKERVGEKGLVEGGWVQQPLILNHPSVGCFVTHCGFGSMWESLRSESQIVMVPHLGDQILNTRLMASELKVGVEVERGEDGWVSKQSLCKAVKTVMDEDNEVGKLVRKNHAKWRHIFNDANFMNLYIDKFIMEIKGLIG